MKNQSVSELKNRILENQSTENIFSILRESYLYSEKNGLYETLKNIHNSQQINIFSIFSRLKYSKSDENLFFACVSIFEKILPDLQGDILEIANCLNHLIQERYGLEKINYLSEGTLLLLSKNESMVEKLLKLSLNDSNYHTFITASLISGANINFEKYFSISSELLKTEFKEQSLHALSLFKYENNNFLSLLKLITDLLENETDDKNLSHIIRAIFKNYLICDKKIELLALAKKTMSAGDVLTQTESLYHVHDLQNKNCLNIYVGLLQYFLNVNHKNTHTLSYLDNLLTNMFQMDELYNDAFGFLQAYLNKSNEETNILTFDYLVNTLISNKNNILGKFITDCFLTKNLHTIAWIDFILNKNSHRFPLFNIDTETAKILSSKDALYLSIKSMGYFFFTPESCIYYIASLIELMDKAEMDSLLSDIMNPFSLSHYDIIQKASKNKDFSKKALSFLKKIKNKLDKFYKKIESVGEIKEFRYSQQNSDIYSKFHADTMKIAMQKAQKNSLLNIFETKTILYGRGSVFYRHIEGEKKKRDVLHLQKITSTYAIPSMPYIDPVGFDFAIFSFKNAGVNK